MVAGDEELFAREPNEREALLEQWRRDVRHIPGAQGLDTPTLNDHIPNLLDELSSTLRSGYDKAAEPHMELNPKHTAYSASEMVSISWRWSQSTTFYVVLCRTWPKCTA